jgi:hypothetical protein
LLFPERVFSYYVRDSQAIFVRENISTTSLATGVVIGWPWEHKKAADPGGLRGLAYSSCQTIFALGSETWVGCDPAVRGRLE